MSDVSDLSTLELSRRIRRHCVEMTHRADASHIGSSLSTVELLAVLFGSIMTYDPDDPEAASRDRFILSKGHGCAAYYAALAECGFFPMDWLQSFHQDGARLAGHATHKGVPGVEVSTGTLGHGLPLATGMALAAQRDSRDHRVFCLISDGECDEGSTWEAALLASHHNLENLVVIVDYNKIQSYGRVEEVIDLEPLAAKWEAFGWGAVEVDGHDLTTIENTLGNIPLEPGRPSCLIAHTVKGKGISFMEDKLLYHYIPPRGEEYDRAIAELDALE